MAVDGLTGNWSLELPLSPGMNRVEVAALDSAGGVVTNLLGGWIAAQAAPARRRTRFHIAP